MREIYAAMDPREVLLLCETALSVNKSDDCAAAVSNRFKPGVRFVEDATTSTRLMLLRMTDGSPCIVFRSTLHWWNTALSLDTEQVPAWDFGHMIRVHRGYKMALDNIWSELMSAVGDAGQVYVVGHSLGAAMSILCGYRLKKTAPWRHVEVVAVGAPRVGNDAFICDYEALGPKSVTINDARDALQYMPLGDTTVRGHVYPRVVGPLLMIENGRCFTVATPPPRSMCFKISTVARWLFINRLECTQNYHSLKHYQSAMQLGKKITTG